jgi:hypothetical protein
VFVEEMVVAVVIMITVAMLVVVFAAEMAGIFPPTAEGVANRAATCKQNVPTKPTIELS